MTTVTLTDEQAALFIIFMKHYDSIGFMISQGVFDIREGNATLNFNQRGNLLSIDKHLFSRRTLVEK